MNAHEKKIKSHYLAMKNVKSVKFEPVSFILVDMFVFANVRYRAIRYKPDFKITMTNGSIIWVECKGFNNEPNYVKLRSKLFKRYLSINHPKDKFEIVIYDRYLQRVVLFERYLLMNRERQNMKMAELIKLENIIRTKNKAEYDQVLKITDWRLYRGKKYAHIKKYVKNWQTKYKIKLKK